MHWSLNPMPFKVQEITNQEINAKHLYKISVIMAPLSIHRMQELIIALCTNHVFS